jgi:hypothetical protein
VAYAHITLKQRKGDKLAPTGRRCVLVGYMPATRQYCLYNPIKEVIIVSSYPTFWEESRYELLDGVLPYEETIGFNPIKADLESDPNLGSPAIYTPAPTPPATPASIQRRLAITTSSKLERPQASLERITPKWRRSSRASPTHVQQLVPPALVESDNEALASNDDLEGQSDSKGDGAELQLL